MSVAKENEELVLRSWRTFEHRGRRAGKCCCAQGCTPIVSYRVGPWASTSVMHQRQALARGKFCASSALSRLRNHDARVSDSQLAIEVSRRHSGLGEAGWPHLWEKLGSIQGLIATSMPPCSVRRRVHPLNHSEPTVASGMPVLV